MIQFSRPELIADGKDVLELHSEFAAKFCVRIPNLLTPDFLSFLDQRLNQGRWTDYVHTGIGVEHVLEDNPAIDLLHFLANLPKFRKVVEDVTDCAPLTLFRGRIYRMVPAAGHYDSWHDDTGNDRLVGMSVNLSSRGYSGGLFQLRERESGRLLTEVANTGFGDAIVFRIAFELQHRVTGVQGMHPKTAFAGWFRKDSKDFYSHLREASATTL